MPQRPTTIRRILISALASLTIGLGLVSLFAGPTHSFLLKLLEGIAIFCAGAMIIGAAVVLGLIRLAGWREPESEIDFEAIVRRAERLAAEGLPGDTEDFEVAADDDLLDPYDEEDFKTLLRRAIDELPLEFHRALEHVAIVVSDGGRRRRAYGLYQ
jgi:hypothetical protein